MSPGLIEVRKHLLGGLYSGELIFGGPYISHFTVYRESDFNLRPTLLRPFLCDKLKMDGRFEVILREMWGRRN